MSDRLALLKPFLSKYTRRFSVLDLGAGINHPTLGYEIQQEFDAVVVEVEKDWKPVATGPRTMVLKHEFTVADLVRLKECEHFDVVLAFNFVHWFGEAWILAADAILDMGDHVFVQIPTAADSSDVPNHDRIECMQGYFKEHAEWLGSTSQFPGHPPRPIYLHNHWWRRLKRTNWDAPQADANVVIHSTPNVITAAFFHKVPIVIRPWIQGINLWSFCRLGGVVPSPEKVKEMLCSLPLPEDRHGDIQPWNMILDGDRLHLIDGGDEWGGDDREGLARTIRKVVECLSSV